jgi:hypothetical protein
LFLSFLYLLQQYHLLLDTNQTNTKMPARENFETPNIDTLNKQLLRVVALGNLSLFVIANHRFITHPVFSCYLALIIILTEIIVVIDTYSNCVIQRRQQQNLRQWPVTTSLLRDVYQKVIYHVYIMNVLLFIVCFMNLFGNGWEYTNYFCGVAYSWLVLLTL